MLLQYNIILISTIYMIVSSCNNNGLFKCHIIIFYLNCNIIFVIILSKHNYLITLPFILSVNTNNACSLSWYYLK